jgi:hypothetical protein
MRRRSPKPHAVARSEQTLRKAVREAKEQPPRKISPALPAATPRVTGKRARQQAANDRAAADAAYRKALGVEGALPNTLGNTSSAGSARGGRGSAQKGKGTRK